MVAAINAGIEQHAFELDGTSPEGPRHAPDLVYEFHVLRFAGFGLRY